MHPEISFYRLMTDPLTSLHDKNENRFKKSGLQESKHFDRSKFTDSRPTMDTANNIGRRRGFCSLSQLPPAWWTIIAIASPVPCGCVAVPRSRSVHEVSRLVGREWCVSCDAVAPLSCILRSLWNSAVISDVLRSHRMLPWLRYWKIFSSVAALQW